MPVSEETYKRVALEGDDERWELICGRLRAKPAMTAAHDHVGRDLILDIGAQIDRRTFTAGDNPRLRVSPGQYFVPDVCIIPMDLVRARLPLRDDLAVYEAPVPFAAEMWSPSTGDYDVDMKFPEYRRRGDREIWRIHPYVHTVTAWVRQPDGSYTETLHRGGMVQLAAVPGVTINLESQFL